MDSEYGKLQTDEINTKTEEKEPWTPFLRQLFVTYSIWSAYFLNGLAFGIPTVMIPQVRKEANSTDAVSPEMASWLYSVFGYSALPWVVILCVAMQYVGRKKPFIFVNVIIFAYFNLLYFSTTLNQVLIAEIMQGVTHASNASLCVVIVTEYISPKYRGLFSTLKSANFIWGVWVSNAIGTFYHWKCIPLLGIIITVLNITVIVWPESPQWLASRGKFEKCMEYHRWLRGTDTQSEKELKHLIQSQIQRTRNTNNGIISTFNGAVRTIFRKEYYMPLLLVILLPMQYQFSGKLVCMMYAIEIIKKITDSESTAYKGMLLLDAVSVVGLFTGCILSRFLNRRTLYFSSTVIGIVVLFVISLYLFLVDLGILVESTILTLALLVLFSTAISCGPLILSTAISGEVTPLRYKGSLTMISTLVFTCSTSTLLKLFPYIYAAFHMSGAFLIYAIISTCICVTTYRYLPETKDKSLQEIEDILIGKKKIIKGEELLPIKNNA